MVCKYYCIVTLLFQAKILFLVSPLLGLTKFNIDTAGVLRAGISEFDYENSGERAFTIVVIARDMGTVPMQRTVSCFLKTVMIIYFYDYCNWYIKIGNSYC